MGYVNSSIEGLTTIRNFKMEHKLVQEFYEHQNYYTSASYTFHCCKFAFTFLIDLLGSFAFIIVLTFCLLLKGIRLSKLY